MKLSILGLAATCLAVVNAQKDNCFPYGNTFQNVNGVIQTPTVSRDQWWCGWDRYYGWLGYVRDLKGFSCSDPVYSLARLREDFSVMSKDGAVMVRIYGPICEQTSVWNNIIQAAAENNLGVLGIVWHGYNPQEEGMWGARKDSLLNVLTNNPLAKYVIHSVSFGSEPLFSWNISDTYAKEFTALKARLKALGYPITVSEMKYGYDQAPKATRDVVIAGIDFNSAHIMPYYGNCLNPADEWNTIVNEIAAFKKLIPKPMMITQNPWGSGQDGRNRGGNCGGDVWKGVTTTGANQYWALWTSHCNYFKEQQVGWFAHTFSSDSEGNFGIYGYRTDANHYPKRITFDRLRCA